jgi:hypothetical protein
MVVLFFLCLRLSYSADLWLVWCLFDGALRFIYTILVKVFRCHPRA